MSSSSGDSQARRDDSPRGQNENVQPESLQPESLQPESLQPESRHGQPARADDSGRGTQPTKSSDLTSAAAPEHLLDEQVPQQSDAAGFEDISPTVAFDGNHFGEPTGAPNSGPGSDDVRGAPTSGEEYRLQDASANAGTVISRRPVAAPEDFYRSMPLAELAAMLEGRHLDHFAVEQMIGGGGMGAVFRGRDMRLDRVVAIKVIPASRRDPETLRRFRLEAQAAARLDHPNIARVFYVGEAEQWNYIVFEFIDGVNIRDLVEIEGPLDVDDAVYYARQVAEALQHAHGREVVHRDIKPSNVLVTANGHVKVVDMGLARNTSLDKSTADATASGITLGTFDYISPEQARNPRDADVRSDLYSLGCTLFFMLTGHPPFPEGTALQKLLNHGSQPPPDPRAWREDLSDQLFEITMKLMAKRPADRYQKPIDLINDLVLLAELEELPRSLTPGTFLVAPSIAQRSLLETHLPWMVAFVFLLVSTLWLQSVQSLTNDLRLADFEEVSFGGAGSRNASPVSPSQAGGDLGAAGQGIVGLDGTAPERQILPNGSGLQPESGEQARELSVGGRTGVPSTVAPRSSVGDEASLGAVAVPDAAGLGAANSRGAPASDGRVSLPRQPLSGEAASPTSQTDDLGPRPRNISSGAELSPGVFDSSGLAGGFGSTRWPPTADGADFDAAGSRRQTVVLGDRSSEAPPASGAGNEVDVRAERIPTVANSPAAATEAARGEWYTALDTLLVANEQPYDAPPGRWESSLAQAIERMANDASIREIEVRGRHVLDRPLVLPAQTIRLRGAGNGTNTIEFSTRAMASMSDGQGLIRLEASQLSCRDLAFRVTVPTDTPTVNLGLFAAESNGSLTLDRCSVTVHDAYRSNSVHVVLAGPRELVGPREQASSRESGMLDPDGSRWSTTDVPTGLDPTVDPGAGSGRGPIESDSPTTGPISLVWTDCVIRGEASVLRFRNPDLAARLEMQITNSMVAVAGRFLEATGPNQPVGQPRFVRLSCSQSTFVTERGFASLELRGEGAPQVGLYRTSEECVYWSRPEVAHVLVRGASRQSALGNLNLLVLRGRENAYDGNIQEVCQFVDGQTLIATYGFTEAQMNGRFDERGNEPQVLWQKAIVPQLPLHEIQPEDLAIIASGLFHPGAGPMDIPPF